jgi:hypothetical protein
MAHKKLENGKVVIDWETGDVEGDRKYLFQAYSDFINECKQHLQSSDDEYMKQIFIKWNISTENQVDEFPRIWIKRPE